MQVALPPEITKALIEQARKRETTPERLALDSLRERFVSSAEEEPPAAERRTLADFLGEHLGVLHSSEHVPGGAQMSEDTGRKFAEGMAKKRREERL